MVVGTIIASVLAGIFGASLIALVHHALQKNGFADRWLIAGFVAVIVLKIVTQCASHMMLVRFAQDTILRLCHQLSEKVLVAPFDRLEALGAPRILATLTDDVAVLSGAVQAIPMIATNFAVVVGCSLYLVWLSWPTFLLCVGGAVIGVLGYRLLLARAHARIQAAREGRDRLFGDFRTLTEGIKELKLNRARRDDFMVNGLGRTTEQLRQDNIGATLQYTVADAWTQLVFFGLIALMLFVAPALSILDTDAGTGYVFAALYMMTPIWSIIGSVPTFMRGRVSLAKMRVLGEDLVAEPGVRRQEAPVRTLETPVHVEFDHVRYSYPAPSSDDQGFTLGPVSVELRSGELVFVTGGNGSGKSTLAKLLTGLYAPHEGSIRLNGVQITDANREEYRQNFSAVFSDFHLFSGLFGIDVARRAGDIERYLQLLHMADKVRIDGNRFSTVALSTGQRKRLALLTAYLEDRPIYVFDEWAADQDPSYKEIFYLRLLPELKARGKCVVVITHDDRYFHQGDRIIRLEPTGIFEGSARQVERNAVR